MKIFCLLGCCVAVADAGTNLPNILTPQECVIQGEVHCKASDLRGKNFVKAGSDQNVSAQNHLVKLCTWPAKSQDYQMLKLSMMLDVIGSHTFEKVFIYRNR